jgi:hypothetical protein
LPLLLLILLLLHQPNQCSPNQFVIFSIRVALPCVVG